ncbi:hypothetical protein ACL02U_03555 [Streptomyces sp. MS06]|uniref:hypothetical protein n=1 Tax=Streptomyces sp. MS06 TaxID=3385974 RepID=UPI00399FAEA3
MRQCTATAKVPFTELPFLAGQQRVLDEDLDGAPDMVREERADHRPGDAKPVDGPDTVTEPSWRYVGSGYTPGAAGLALGIAEDHAQSLQLARQAREDVQKWGEWL